jgi:MraZ protein
MRHTGSAWVDLGPNGTFINRIHAKPGAGGETMSQDQEPETPETSNEATGHNAGAGAELKYGYNGNPKTKLDERGRLKMPAEFKAFTERKYGKGFNAFYITSMDGESAEIYPLPEWLERQKKVFAMPQSHPARKMLLDRYNLYGDRADMDPQGRMQIPDELRKKADLTGDVKVSGEGNLLRVTSMSRLRENVDGSEFTPEQLDSLSGYGL